MKVYDHIGESWYNIRHHTIFRKELSELNEKWKGGRLLNIGCAHGPDFVPFNPEKFFFYGTDSSKELVKKKKKYARKKGLVFRNCVSDMRNLPYRESSFDYLVCIASLHHLLERKERVEALKEMARVLSGRGFITVWDRENPDLPPGKKITKEWNKSGQVLKRQYYIYDREELDEELEEAGFLSKIRSDGRNLLAEIKLK